MAVDRIHRDALADILAALLRDEVDSTRFAASLQSIRAECDNALIKDQFLKEMLDRLEFLNPGSWGGASPEEWEHLRRHLAFLRTDLEPPAFLGTDLEPQAPFLLLHVLAFAAALVFSFWIGWWLLWIVWAISGTLGMILLQFQGRIWDRERASHAQFYPFQNEEEWLAHEQALDAFQFPSFEAWRERHPLAKPNRLATAALSAFFWGLIACMVALGFAWGVFMWPLWALFMLIAELFQRKNRKKASP